MINRDDERWIEIKKEIMEMLIEEGAPADLSPNADFMEMGILDSFGALSLIMSLEATFSISFNPMNLAESRSRTVNGLTDITYSGLIDG